MNNEPVYRLFPPGVTIYSIINRTPFITVKETIVKIITSYDGEYYYVKPMLLLFNYPHMLPTLIEYGTDEWGVYLSDSTPYEVPLSTLFAKEVNEPPK